MSERPRKDRPAKQAETREERLKAALKANLQRRKAQAKARCGADEAKPEKPADKAG